MKAYNYHILLLLKRLFLALMLFSISRLVFYLINYELFTGLGLWQFIGVFIIGMRFDLSVIIYFNMLFILMHILPLGVIKSRKPWQLFLKWYFVLVNAMLIFINLADAKYFNFILKRSTADVLKFIFLSDDVPTLIPQFLAAYWYLPVIWDTLMIMTWFVYPALKPEKLQKLIREGANRRFLSTGYQFTAFIVLMGLSFIGARGGVQLKPLMIVHASKYTTAKYIPLVLNTPFTIMTTYGHKDLDVPEYFTYEECEKIYPTLHQYEFADTSFRRMNVVIILFESYSREYSGFLNGYRGYTPFLDSLMQHSLVFSNAFANSHRSIDAVLSIIAGLPTLMDDPIITSVYSTNNLYSLAHILNKEEYNTAFFHGGTNGTMGFDGFAGMAGFDDYYGRTEYGNEEDYDGYWGIYDEPFLQYFAAKLNSFKQPFFAFEFALSSHFPYSIPEQHKGKFKEGPLKIHKVVSYTDYALKQFFKTASKMPWYNNTIFMVMADHPAQSVIPSNIEDIEDPGEKLDEYSMKFYNNTHGRYAIPMLCFVPSDSSINGIDTIITQQSDMIPSILYYLRYNKPFMAFGNNVFDDSANHLAVAFVNGIYQVSKGRYSLLFDGEKSIALYDNMADPEHKRNLLLTQKQTVQELEIYIKAIYQQYNYRLVNNKLVPPGVGNLR